MLYHVYILYIIYIRQSPEVTWGTLDPNICLPINGTLSYIYIYMMLSLLFRRKELKGPGPPRLKAQISFIRGAH